MCPEERDTAAVRRSFPLTCLVAAIASFSIPAVAAACSLPPLSPPPPRTAAESEEEFAARTRKWYGDLNERERQEWLSQAAPEQERLWEVAERIVLARVVRVGTIRLRGSEGQWYESPLATLRPIRWLKGSSSATRLQVHFLSDDTCDHGAGPAPEGEVGETFLLFYRRGHLNPRNILDTIDEQSAATARTQQALRQAEAAE
jgi:hypothetical protein